MNAFKTISTIAILTAAVAVSASESRPYTGEATTPEVVADGVLYDSTGGSASGIVSYWPLPLGNIVFDTRDENLYTFEIDSVTFEYFTPESAEGTISVGFYETERYDLNGRWYYRPTLNLVEGSGAVVDVYEGPDALSVETITYDTPVTLSYGLNYDLTPTGEYTTGGFAFLICSEDIDSFGLNIASEKTPKSLSFVRDSNTAWYVKKGTEDEFQKKNMVAPFSFEIEGTATKIGVANNVPEAGTMSLALMGLAALGGFAGLRRFKRN